MVGAASSERLRLSNMDGIGSLVNTMSEKSGKYDKYVLMGWIDFKSSMAYRMVKCTFTFLVVVLLLKCFNLEQVQVPNMIDCSNFETMTILFDFVNAAKECKKVLDAVEKIFPHGIPKAFVETKLQETIS